MICENNSCPPLACIFLWYFTPSYSHWEKWPHPCLHGQAWCKNIAICPHGEMATREQELKQLLCYYKTLAKHSAALHWFPWDNTSWTAHLEGASRTTARLRSSQLSSVSSPDRGMATGYTLLYCQPAGRWHTDTHESLLPSAPSIEPCTAAQPTGSTPS